MKVFASIEAYGALTDVTSLSVSFTILAEMWAWQAVLAYPLEL
jgi:hypothetical protein